jgi:hypothetical protein
LELAASANLFGKLKSKKMLPSVFMDQPPASSRPASQAGWGETERLTIANHLSSAGHGGIF